MYFYRGSLIFSLHSLHKYMYIIYYIQYLMFKQKLWGKNALFGSNLISGKKQVEEIIFQPIYIPKSSWLRVYYNAALKKL